MFCWIQLTWVETRVTTDWAHKPNPKLLMPIAVQLSCWSLHASGPPLSPWQYNYSLTCIFCFCSKTLWQMSQVSTNPLTPLYFSPGLTWWTLTLYILLCRCMIVRQISHQFQFLIRYCGTYLVIVLTSISVQVILQSYLCPSLGGKPNCQVSGALSELSISASRALRIPTSVFQLYCSAVK